VKSLSSLYIVIDGLDECSLELRGQLLHTLVDLVNPDKFLTQIKILISSRDADDVHHQLGQFPHLSVDKTDTSSDIEEYVRSEIRRCVDDGMRLRRCLETNPELEEEIVDKLTSQADGM